MWGIAAMSVGLVVLLWIQRERLFRFDKFADRHLRPLQTTFSFVLQQAALPEDIRSTRVKVGEIASALVCVGGVKVGPWGRSDGA